MNQAIYFSLPIGSGPITLDGQDVILVGRPSRPFAAERFVITALLPPPRALLLLARIFRWLHVPWVAKKWDDDEERYRRRLLLIHPFSSLYSWVDGRAQRRALAGVSVKSIRVGPEEQLVGNSPVPSLMFAPDVPAVHLSLRTCQVNQSIEVTLAGHGGPVSVVAIGRVVGQAN